MTSIAVETVFERKQKINVFLEKIFYNVHHLRSALFIL